MLSEDVLSKELEDFMSNTGIEPKPEPEPVVGVPKDPIVPVVAPVVSAPEPIGEPVVELEPKPVEPPVEPIEAEPTPVAVGIEEPLTEREKLLMARLEEVTRRSLEAGAPVTPTTPVVQPVVAPIVAPVVVPQPLNFIGDNKLDDILDSPEKFNAVLVEVYNKGMEAAQQGAVKEVLKSVPGLINSHIGRHTTMTSMVGDFYKENPDLVGVKRTVAAVANEVAAEDPSMAVDKVFEKTAERTRRVLGMPGATVTPSGVVMVKPSPVPAPQGSPAFVGQGSRRAASTSGLKGLAAEINDLVVD